MNTINIAKNDFSDIELAAIPFNTLADHYGERLAREQLALEHESYEMGEARFRKMFERQLKAGEVADNAAAKPLITTLLPKMIARINDWFEEVKAKRGKRPTAFQFLQEIKPEAVAYITIKTTLACLTSADNTTVQAVASAIGRAIEDEARFGRIRDLEAKHFKKNVEEQLNKRVGHVYKKAFMQVVEADMLSKGLLGGEAWSSWHKEDSIHVGVRCIEMLIESTGMVSLHRQNAGVVGQDSETIELAPEYAEAIATRAGALAGISPMFQPCVVPPKPWTGITGGGYWANGRRPLALVRTHSKKALMRYEDVYMPEVYKAINIAQNTAWKINKKVLAVANVITKWKHCPVEDIPAIEREELPMKPEDIDMNPEALTAWKRAAAAVYRKDKARKSRRISLEFMLEQANKFANHKAIWFPYNMDWRGRVYAVSMFNPQGNDMTKGLLTLAKGKPIGKEGYYWLKIHGANCAGVDKVPFPERIKFIEENHENIMACAKSPLENTWWAEQDSPFCFLAFCFEYAGVQHHGLSYNCSLPLAFDGSCSGIQHFSAMLRDEVGGRAVNLLPSEFGGSGGSGGSGHTLYAPGGYDIMGYLIQIMNRPNPQVELGPVDTSCALILCDLKQKDTPIVYASEAFLYMTGYSNAEVLGRNCRFLQSPDGMVKPKSTRKYVDSNTINTMRKAIDRNAEVQVEVVNFKKNGQRFVNFLTMIPVRDETGEYRYSMGFQCETE
nr:N564-VVD fusion protein [Expression vector paT7P-1]